jgi:hypothetical protein
MRCTPYLAVTVLLMASSVARAQVGTGWVQYQPPSVIHLDGSAGIESYPGSSTNLRNEGASFTNENGVETFALHDPISNRSERRMQNTYLTGRHQFEGEVRVSPPTNDESIMQVFGGNSGATTQMIRAYDEGGGTLKKVPGSVVLASNIHGVWVKLNVIHDVGGNFVRTYIDGRLVTTGDGEAVNAGNDGWYHKYGCYGTLRTGSAKVEWRNVKHFREGTPPTSTDGGMPEARPADGGEPSPDAGVDAAPPPDASAPGAGGASGGGSGGTSGGAGGASGGGQGGASGGGAPTGAGGAAKPTGAGGARKGQGGAAAPDPGDDEPATAREAAASGGLSCRAGGQAGQGTLVLLVPLLAWLMRRRRR